MQMGVTSHAEDDLTCLSESVFFCITSAGWHHGLKEGLSPFFQAKHPFSMETVTHEVPGWMTQFFSCEVYVEEATVSVRQKEFPER